MSANDYFQDITPPSPDRPASQGQPRSIKINVAEESGNEPPSQENPEKSIRNIQVPIRPRRTFEAREASPQPKKRRLGRYPLWGGVGIALLVLAALAAVALRPTTVTVTPRAHMIFFDESARFHAYPSTASATGTLTFAVETFTYEDSQVVKASGVEKVEEKASGTITVYNEYSAAPVKLLKNTRFETPDGLIFRIPAEVSVPGKRGTTPGEITVTVFADSAGEKYNVAPVSHFSLPGLKGGTMFSKVYARSTSAISGGFLGERPAAEKSVLDAAISEIRSRLGEKARGEIAAREGSFAFLELGRLSYESVPPIKEGGSNVRIGERLRVELPVFPADPFAKEVAEAVSAEAEVGEVILKKGEGFSAKIAGAQFAPELPFSFSLSGQAQLVWRVDVQQLRDALAGRHESAFQTIIQGFTGVEEAHARIEPFWSNSFPENARGIKVKIKEPSATSH